MIAHFVRLVKKFIKKTTPFERGFTMKKLKCLFG